MNFRKPQPLTRRSFVNAKKHCSFHDDIGHSKNECVSLKNEIEAAVKSGKLGHLVKGGKPGTGGHKVGGKERESDEEEWKNEPVIFPRIKGGPCNKNPLIITSLLGHYRSQYVFFDIGSTSDIVYEQCFEQLDEDNKERLKPIHAPVSGFGGEVMHPRGVISFPVTLSDGIHSRTEEVEFLVLPATSKHDIILGREAIGDFSAHPSTAHGAVGVTTRTGVAIIHINRHCFATESSKPSKVPKKTRRTEPEKWVLNKKFPEQTVTIGPTISEIVRKFLKQLLTKNVDIFVWQPADMTGVPQKIAEHKLRVNSVFTPVMQKKRKMGPEKTKAMNEQVQDLLHAGIIRSIQYQTWVANPVIVPKRNGTWRMCIEFEDLNKACPKDYYPLPEIDLKNAGATYQRLMDEAFETSWSELGSLHG
ncbi:uncharacterized protein LOC143622615 [Bidens hawaiensis]|uniref:uncharacterized protein LOC143622615 n=1 Tax=Bidens hawaiensis TaxID=980011 RepID=UPI004049427F